MADYFTRKPTKGRVGKSRPNKGKVKRPVMPRKPKKGR